MKIIQWDVIVIGGGPSGISAATTASEQGLSVLLLDDQPYLGGQIYRHASAPNSAKNYLEKEDYNKAQKCFERFEASGAFYFARSTVWHINQEKTSFRVIYSKDGNSYTVYGQAVVLATGGMERPVPFEGWTLPGVMQAGAADVLYKIAGVLPPQPIVIAGNGPIITLVSSHLAKLGVSVAGILQTRVFPSVFNLSLSMLSACRDIPFLLKGFKMQNEANKLQARVYPKVTKIQAKGDNCLQSVSFVSKGEIHEITAKTLLFHEGMLPRTQFSKFLKLSHAWNNLQKYWYPVVNEFGQSSIPNIYVVGDATSIHGAEAAIQKGLLAGLDIATNIGVISKNGAKIKNKSIRKSLKKAIAPRAFVDNWFKPNILDIDDNVVVCKCENITAGEIRQAVAEGLHNIGEIKLRTRCGMGACQGRSCSNAMQEIIAKEAKLSPEDIGMLKIRTPVRPVNLEEYINHPNKMENIEN